MRLFWGSKRKTEKTITTITTAMNSYSTRSLYDHFPVPFIWYTQKTLSNNSHSDEVK